MLSADVHLQQQQRQVLPVVSPGTAGAIGRHLERDRSHRANPLDAFDTRDVSCRVGSV